jgi:hypothetical protein
LTDEHARLAERQRLLVATADVQRLRLACHWLALKQSTRPGAVAAAAISALRQHGRWLALLAPLVVLARRAYRRSHADSASAPWLGDALHLARWALRLLRVWLR